MSSVVASVLRGSVVESRHLGVIAVADTDGRLVASAGDPTTTAFFRSSAKPFQAVPLVESGAADRFGFTEAELAMACASHAGIPWQQDVVSGMLEKIGLGPADLRCGTAPPYDEDEAARVRLGVVPATPLQCDCSGKHAGMLATCVQMGWPTDSYLDPGHPLQQAILSVIAAALRMDVPDILIATDGCSVPTFGAPVAAFATAYATFARPESVPAAAGGRHAASLTRLREAIVRHPAHINGPGEPDTDLIAITGGRVVAKMGAEGLLCLAVPGEGLGIAISIGDGSSRPEAVVATAVLDQLGQLWAGEVEALRTAQSPVLTNFNGRTVGEIRADVELETAH